MSSGQQAACLVGLCMVAAGAGTWLTVRVDRWFKSRGAR